MITILLASEHSPVSKPSTVVMAAIGGSTREEIVQVPLHTDVQWYCFQVRASVMDCQVPMRIISADDSIDQRTIHHLSL